MSLKYIRDTYGVPARRGRFVEIRFPEGNLYASGTIRGAVRGRLKIGKFNFHPTWNVIYFSEDRNSVEMDTRNEGQILLKLERGDR